MIAQDTGSAIVGPARADIFWGAGEEAARLAGGVHHPATFAMLVPREVDPVAAGARMPLPPEKPPLPGEANARTSLPKPATLVQGHRFTEADEFRRNLRPQSRQQSGCSGTSDPSRTPRSGRTEPNRHVRSASPVAAGADCGSGAKAAQPKEVAKRVFSGFASSTERKPSVIWRREN
jgi:membrane-bound lytic murein transglycosylase A